MKLCKACVVPMQNVMSFSQEKHERFCRCPKCHGETKHNKIKDNELVFGEVLHKAMKNRK